MHREKNHVGLGCLALALYASCTISSDVAAPTRVEIATNDLGVAAIETQRYKQDGDNLFELRGVDSSDNEVASVRLRIGTIADLPHVSEGVPALGSEVIYKMNGRQLRTISREINLLRVHPADASVQAFLELPAVSSTLAREAHIEVMPTRPGLGEVALDTQTCPESVVNSSPTAVQCCYGPSVYGAAGETRFMIDGGCNGNGQISFRTQSPYGPCTGSDGSSCGGSACYYGPNGFSRAQIWDTCSDIVVPAIWTGNGYCQSGFYSSPPPLEFGNVNGTNSPGAMCPGGDYPGDWDY